MGKFSFIPMLHSVPCPVQEMVNCGFASTSCSLCKRCHSRFSSLFCGLPIPTLMHTHTEACRDQATLSLFSVPPLFFFTALLMWRPMRQPAPKQLGAAAAAAEAASLTRSPTALHLRSPEKQQVYLRELFSKYVS